MVASLPVLVKRTASADGTMRQKRSAASISADVAAAKCEPSATASETTETSVGCAWPWMSAPNDIMKSIKERSKNEEELGMYWRDTELSFSWVRAPIETQAMMIEAFDEVMNDDKAVEACEKNQAMLDKIAADQKFAFETLKVGATPTFFINGEMLKGAMSFEELDAKLKSLLNR